jgi:hypothetical protein
MALTPFDPNNNPFAQYSPEDQADIKDQLVTLKNSGKLNSAQVAGVTRALRYFGVDPGPLELPGMPVSGLRQTATGADLLAPTRALVKPRSRKPTPADMANTAMTQALGEGAP